MGEEDVGESLCGKCNQEIQGQAMKAKDTLYHAEGCFICQDCSMDLRNVAVYCKDAALYCEKDYKKNFVPLCSKCKEYILENCVRAMDQTWHANHFSCYTCDKQFTAETGYHEHQGRPFCEPCYSDAALPKCKGCAKPIKDKAIKALNADWHLSCFVCKIDFSPYDDP